MTRHVTLELHYVSATRGEVSSLEEENYRRMMAVIGK